MKLKKRERTLRNYNLKRLLRLMENLFPTYSWRWFRVSLLLIQSMVQLTNGLSKLLNMKIQLPMKILLR